MSPSQTEPTSTAPSKIRVAIVGCGSVSEHFHAPALRGFDGFAPVAMIDRDASRAQKLATLLPGSQPGSHLSALRGNVDAAIVALPGHLNTEVTRELLGMGISVLVEKPAAVNSEQARSLVEASKGTAKLSVGFIRREAVGLRLARHCIQSGMLGKIHRFSIEDGYVFAWQAVHEFRFDRARGGGILNDIGSHVLDTVTFWFGPSRIVKARDDNAGGVETNVSLEVETAGGVPGTVELSWTRELRNSAVIEGENGTLEVRWYNRDASLTLSTGLHTLGGDIHGDMQLDGGGETFPLMFLSQLQRWHQSLASPASPAAAMAGATEALANVELIEACRKLREPMDMSWRQIPLRIA